MSAIFYSLNEQTKPCIICRRDDEKALKKKGPIVNHLVGKHGGTHAACLTKWFNQGHHDCPLCRASLNPHSFPLGREIVQREIIPLELELAESPILDLNKSLKIFCDFTKKIFAIAVVAFLLRLYHVIQANKFEPGLTDFVVAALIATFLNSAVVCAGLKTLLVANNTLQ